MKLLHGTSTKLLPRIERQGLKANSYQSGEYGVFLTDDAEVLEQSKTCR